MEDQMMQPVWWHWAALGVVFVTIEIFVPGGFLIGLGIAAFLTGALVFVAETTAWEYQLLVFAAVAFVSVFAMRQFFRSTPIESDQPLLNQRGRQYVGRRFTLEEPIVNGGGKIRVDDSSWKIRGEDCEAGTTVEIVGVDGTVLEARRAPS